MRFGDIVSRIANNRGFTSHEETRQAGYRLVKARDSNRYFLARSSDLQPLLVKLGEIAEVRRGFTTGANEFFYLEPASRPSISPAQLQGQDAQATVRVKNGAGWEGEIEAAWLRPVIKSPRELKALRVRPEDLRYRVFMPPDEVRSQLERLVLSGELQQRYPKAWAYIQWGEQQGYHKRSTCASRPRWWDLGEHRLSDLIFPCGVS
ncbi:MAG: hypothetical protein NZL85_06095, partial [Fimbriimonadales bacterium]|nr:hypothetical protein [Fimbriimonadales bacterium]